MLLWTAAPQLLSVLVSLYLLPSYSFATDSSRYSYFLGVGEVMLDLGLVCPATKVSGASSGSLVAVMLKCGMDTADVIRSTLVRNPVRLWVWVFGGAPPASCRMGPPCASPPLIPLPTHHQRPPPPGPYTHQRFAQDVRTHGIHGRLGSALRRYLEAHLPRDAGAANDGSTYLAVTRVWPTVRTWLHNSFGSTQGLIDTMMASW